MPGNAMNNAAPAPETSGLKIETRTIHPVPLDERHGKAWHLGPFWFTGNFVLTTMVTGFLGGKSWALAAAAKRERPAASAAVMLAAPSWPEGAAPGRHGPRTGPPSQLGRRLTCRASFAWVATPCCGPSGAPGAHAGD